MKREDLAVELRGFEPLTPSMRTRCATGLRYSPLELALA
jgi:site-specific DNA recombinase